MGLEKLDSIELSHYILAKWGAMTHLKLQKLVYYVESFHLAYFSASLIDDDFEAWMHGPVSPKVWHVFKDAASPLHNEVSAPNRDVIANVNSRISGDQRELIEDVLNEYGKRTAYYLECLTHQEEPWIEARNGVSPDEKCHSKIAKKTMEKFYRTMIYAA